MNSAIPCSSMSRFEVKPRSRSTLTSTQRPWQSKPFCQRWSSPRMAWKRWKTSLYIRPQAWCTPIGLLAVIGPSRKLQRGPPAFWARRRANVRRSRQRARISCSWATRSGLLVTGANIWPRARVGSCGPGVHERHASARSAVTGPRTHPTEVPRILPAMQQQHEARPRARSAFTAAFLSLLFPGLGHAYAGAWYRAVAFAAAPFLLLALLAGAALSYKIEILGVALQPPVLVGILVGNVVAYIYRIVAAVDSHRVVRYLNRVADGGAGRLGPARASLAPISLAGLLAVILVMGGAHAAVAYYDLQALTAVQNIFNPTDTGAGTGPSPSPGATNAAGATASPAPSPSDAAAGSTTAPSLVPWNGTGRLNILLIGTDKRPNEDTWNTDTLIVASIDPASRQVAMFSLPRDTVGVPLPPIPARSVFGATWDRKINALFGQARARPDLFPGGGYEGLKDTRGYLYGIPINYFVEGDFSGFKTVVDALGGVTVNVQVPVVDDYYPGDNGTLRVYIPTGVQHMTGSQALIYARSRHGSDDFDRASRQQRVILSLRQQADFTTLIQRLPDLVQSTSKAVKTDYPIAKLPQLIELASRIDIGNVRSFVFSPPYYR